MSSPRRIVVLGSGTGVGKTWVTVGLARALREFGGFVKAVKPFETGVAPADERAVPTDFEQLAGASSVAPTPPLRTFLDPVSPHLAARRQGVTLSVAEAVQHVKRDEQDMTRHVMSFMLIESAGGCFTPLAPGVRNVELAVALEPALWVLVAPDALGVLHDIGATLAALAAVARPPDHLVLCAARSPDASTGTNAAELRALGIADPIASLGPGDCSGLETLARRLISA